MYKSRYLYEEDELDFTPIVQIPLEPPMNSVFPIISKLPPKPVINLGEYPRTSDFTPIVPITSEPAMKLVIPIIPPKAPKTTGGEPKLPPGIKPMNILTASRMPGGEPKLPSGAPQVPPIVPIVPPGGLKYPSSRVKTNPFLTPYVPESELVIPPKGLPNQGLEAINPKLRSNIPPKTQKTSGGKYWF